MKKVIYAFTGLIFLFSTTQQSTAAGTLVTISKGMKQEGKQRGVSGFKGIASSGSFDVRITMANKENVRLEGDEDQIREIETVVENGILKIRNKKNNWNRHLRGKVTVYVTAKSLNSLTVSGSGNLVVNGEVNSSHLSSTLSGSGSITLTADADEYVATISGSGRIVVKGRADQAEIQISGSGDFDGKNLRTSTADVNVSGSGNVSIIADKTLQAKVSGSGNIAYGGNPKVSQTKSGSGSISRL
jgi:hypothetical protein